MAGHVPYCDACGAQADPCTLSWFPSPCMCTAAEPVTQPETPEMLQVKRVRPPLLDAAPEKQAATSSKAS